MGRARDFFAYAHLRMDYMVAGLPVFNFRRPPYALAVMLDRRQAERQTAQVAESAAQVADRYGLEALVDGPRYVAGGRQVVYVGLAKLK